MAREGLGKKLREWWRFRDAAARAEASGALEWEAREMEDIFGLLTLGAFCGLPSPPMQLTLELLPLMERELLLVMDKAGTANDPLAELFSTPNVL